MTVVLCAIFTMVNVAMAVAFTVEAKRDHSGWTTFLAALWWFAAAAWLASTVTA